MQHKIVCSIETTVTPTADDARQANIIYGPDVFALKASSVKSQPTPIPSFVPTTILSYVLEKHKDVTLCADFYVQSQVFLYTLSRKIKFHCVASVEDHTKNTQFRVLRSPIDLYRDCGFTV